jgi:O-antigen/teichoic acid export membrane protein
MFSHSDKLIYKNTLILFVKLVLVSVLGFAFSRFSLNALGFGDFGLYSAVTSVVFAMSFLNIVMVTTTYRFIAFEEGKSDGLGVDRVFSISLLIHGVLALLVWLLSEVVGVFFIRNYLDLAGHSLNDALYAFRVLVFAASISMIGVPFQGLLIARENFLVLSLLDIVKSALNFCAALFVIDYEGNRLKMLTILISAISIFVLIFLILHAWFKYKNTIKFNFKGATIKLREMLSFSVWVFFGAAASASEMQLSILLLNTFFGTIVNAAFAISLIVNNVVKSFALSLNQSMIPQITKSYGKGDKRRSLDLVIFSSKFSFFICLFLAIPLFFETDFLLLLWLDSVPNGTSTFIKFVAVSSTISSMTAGFPAIIQASGKIKVFSVLLSALSLIGLPASFVLFKSGYGPFSLSIVYLIVTMLNFILVLILSSVHLGLSIRELYVRAYKRMFMVVFSLFPLLYVLKVEFA